MLSALSEWGVLLRPDRGVVLLPTRGNCNCRIEVLQLLLDGWGTTTSPRKIEPLGGGGLGGSGSGSGLQIGPI